MNPYYVDVRSILGDTGASIFVDDSIEFDRLVVGDESFVQREPASFSVTISNAGTGIVAHGSITAKVTATCVRCLCEFDDEITGDVEGTYLAPGQEPLDDEAAQAVDSEGRIDLEPALTAALVIEAPFAPLHDEECQGLCSSCGADLNEGPCACEKTVSEDHPFAALKSLMQDDDRDPSAQD